MSCYEFDLDEQNENISNRRRYHKLSIFIKKINFKAKIKILSVTIKCSQIEAPTCGEIKPRGYWGESQPVYLLRASEAAMTIFPSFLVRCDKSAYGFPFKIRDVSLAFDNSKD